MLSDDSDLDDSEATELNPKAPVIVTAVSRYPMLFMDRIRTIDAVLHSFQASKRGELPLNPQDTITVLTSHDTPFGWKYGEIVTTRRGIFPGTFLDPNVLYILRGD